jgi:hypothetical protein
MDPIGLRVTLDNYLPGEGDRLNAICRTHADRMNMPRDWVIDDRRTNNPTLFKVQQAATPARREDAGKSRRKARPFPKAESFDTLSIVRPAMEPATQVEEPVVETPVMEVAVVDERIVEAPVIEMPEVETAADTSPVVEAPTVDDVLEPTQAMPWRPRFEPVKPSGDTGQSGGRLLSRANGSDETMFMQRPKPAKELDREPFGEHDIP